MSNVSKFFFVFKTILDELCSNLWYYLSFTWETKRPKLYLERSMCKFSKWFVVCFWLSTGANEYLLAVSCVGCIASWVYSMELFCSNSKRLLGIFQTNFQNSFWVFSIQGNVKSLMDYAKKLKTANTSGLILLSVLWKGKFVATMIMIILMVDKAWSFFNRLTSILKKFG